MRSEQGRSGLRSTAAKNLLVARLVHVRPAGPAGVVTADLPALLSRDSKGAVYDHD
jgi:hypothetical protein